MNWAKDIKAGDLIKAYGISCLGEDSSTHEVYEDQNGLYVPCTHGNHYLDGQLDDEGQYIGITRP